MGIEISVHSMMIKISRINSVFCSYCFDRRQIISNNLGEMWLTYKYSRKAKMCDKSKVIGRSINIKKERNVLKCVL